MGKSKLLISGPVCPINPKPKGGNIAQGGAMTSAFLSAFL